MKGQSGGGGISIFNVLLFYTVFLFFVAAIGVYAGVTILTVGGNPNNIPIPVFNPIDILGSVVSVFNFFVGFLSTSTTYVLLAAILVTPFIVMLLYALLQLIRGTG
jgi:hypothetical protein